MKLFDDEQFLDWKRIWDDMPEYDHDDETSVKQINVHFRSLDDLREFGELLGQKLTYKTKSLWYPEMPFKNKAEYRYYDEE